MLTNLCQKLNCQHLDTLECPYLNRQNQGKFTTNQNFNKRCGATFFAEYMYFYIGSVLPNSWVSMNLHK